MKKKKINKTIKYFHHQGKKKMTHIVMWTIIINKYIVWHYAAYYDFQHGNSKTIMKNKIH